MAVPRNHAFAAAVNGNIYVIGGRTGHGFIMAGTNTDAVEEYDPANDLWSAPKDRMPTPRSGGGWGTDGRRIYVAGGEVTTKQLVGAFRAIEAYDPATNSWATLPSNANAASRRSGCGDRQSLSPGERDDHVRRRDGDARPASRSPHGGRTTYWSCPVGRASPKTSSLRQVPRLRQLPRLPQLPRPKRYPTPVTTSRVPKDKRCSRNMRRPSRS